MLVAGTSESAPWISQAVADGAGVVRVNAKWALIAPPVRPPGFNAADPNSLGYDWSRTDGPIEDLAAHGVAVCLTLYSAPVWAEGPGRAAWAEPGTWRPNAAAFAAFATAVATRYDGHFPDPAHPGQYLPRVRCYQAWNEPNIDFYLSPQFESTGDGQTNVGPDLYRPLLNRLYAAVKLVSPSNFVLMGGTAPFGQGVKRTAPVAFYRSLFCLKGRLTLKAVDCPGPVHLDGIDHHPQAPAGPTWHAPHPDDVGVPDINRITRVLHAAVASGHVLPKGRKGLWVTELEWSSNPPAQRGVPMEEDAHWYEQAFYELWHQRVGTVTLLQLRDRPPNPNAPSQFQSAPYYADGTPTLIATAYRFPFVVEPLRGNRVVAWGRSPARGQLRIEALRQGRWSVVRTLSVRRWQVFSTPLSSRGVTSWRADVGSQTSLVWTPGAYGSRPT